MEENESGSMKLLRDLEVLFIFNTRKFMEATLRNMTASPKQEKE